MSVFGPLVSALDAENHVEQIIRRWLPTYLYEIERTHGLEPGTLPLLRSIVRSSEIEKFPEDQLPCLMLASPGLTDPPEADGGGYYSANWQINLGVEIVAAPNRRAVELARLYTLAVRAAVIQQQQDPGLQQPVRMVRIDWRDERYDVLDSIDDRTVCIGRVEFGVSVVEVLQRGLGPLDPLIGPQPPSPVAPDWPTSETVITTVEKEPI